jgi:hypothetical protein
MSKGYPIGGAKHLDGRVPVLLVISAVRLEERATKRLGNGNGRELVNGSLSGPLRRVGSRFALWVIAGAFALDLAAFPVRGCG